MTAEQDRLVEKGSFCALPTIEEILATEGFSGSPLPTLGGGELQRLQRCRLLIPRSRKNGGKPHVDVISAKYLGVEKLDNLALFAREDHNKIIIPLYIPVEVITARKVGILPEPGTDGGVNGKQDIAPSPSPSPYVNGMFP